MPGKEASELTYREARQEGRLEEYRESRGRGKKHRYKDSNTTHSDFASPGDTIAAKHIHDSGEFDAVEILIRGAVPREYQAILEIERGGSSYEQVFEVQSGANVIESMTMDHQLSRGDIITVRLDSSVQEEVQQIGPIFATITTLHE